MEVDLLTIDPGVHKSAIALWGGGRLLFADDIQNPAVFRLLEGLPAARLVIETPILYPTKRKQHKDVKDLLIIVKRMRSVMGKSNAIAPAAWKGQVPKKIHGMRIFNELAREEILAVASIDNHNTIDAIGIGLWVLGRLGRGGVPRS